MASSRTDPTVLDQTFSYTSATYTFTIAHTTLGSPSSPPLIFIHGTPWTSAVWKPLALSLSRQFHVHLADNPGFGASPLEEPLAGTPPKFATKVEEYDSDLARQTEAWAALFREWQKNWKDGVKPHVVAHDHAGLMSLRAHLLHGCEYASLCLIDVVAIGPFGKPLFKAVADSPSAFAAMPDMALEGILESYIRNAAFYELPKETVKMLKEPWLREGGKAGFIRQLCQAAHRSTEVVEWRYPEVGKAMPVKIIWGAQDDWIGEESAWRLGKALGAQEVTIIQDAGHLIMYDQPAQLAVELTRWLCTTNWN